jgi:hypothetical protein|tara:strand:+ start:330 stop:467 length:138 start_codon:yes stop_codon:yes gene_type:complete
MKLQSDIIERWEKGDTVYEIAKDHNTTVHSILQILGLDEDPWHYD